MLCNNYTSWETGPLDRHESTGCATIITIGQNLNCFWSQEDREANNAERQYSRMRRKTVRTHHHRSARPPTTSHCYSVVRWALLANTATYIDSRQFYSWAIKRPSKLLYTTQKLEYKVHKTMFFLLF